MSRWAYGAFFVAERLTRVGLVAMGYADGYPRVVPTGTPVIRQQARSHRPGVSMDMLTVDLSGLAGAGSRPGQLWGAQVPINADCRRCRHDFPTNCCATSSARGSSIAAWAGLQAGGSR